MSYFSNLSRNSEGDKTVSCGKCFVTNSRTALHIKQEYNPTLKNKGHISVTVVFYQMSEVPDDFCCICRHLLIRKGDIHIQK